MILKFLVGLGMTIVIVFIVIGILLLVKLLAYGIEEIKETKPGKVIRFIGKLIGKIISLLFGSLVVVWMIATIYQLGDAILR